MKILVENSGYNLTNMGDVAMLQVAVNRLMNLWPDASIFVLTNAPDKLATFCPNATALGLIGRDCWLAPIMYRLYQRFALHPKDNTVFNIEWFLRSYFPFLVKIIIQLKLIMRPQLAREFSEFIQLIYESDLVIATGGGYITDVFKDHAFGILGTLSLAAQSGKTTVIVGNGLGPLHNQLLYEKTKTVFLKLNLMTLREKRGSIPILQGMGVNQSKVLITGDDAIELAYQVQREELGNGIGVNLRVAEYSAVSLEIVDTIRATLHEAALSYHASLMPVPISLADDDTSKSDLNSIRELLRGYNQIVDCSEELDTPLKVMERVSHCRVVVTGSYHAGVFALAQGIPVVGLIKSEYYIDKFLGLADQFEVGCEVVSLKSPQLQEELLASIRKAWETAPALKPKLLAASRQQIESGYAAYTNLRELVVQGAMRN